MKRLAILAVSAMGFLACGPGAKIGNGKQGAAEALMAASSPTKSGADKASGGIDIAGAVTFSCPKGGQAKLSGFSLSVGTIGAASISQSFTLEYLACGLADSDVGVAIYNGSWKVDQSITTSGASVQIEQKFVGNVRVEGAFNDHIDANVTQRISAGVLNGTGSVSAQLVGTITTDSGAYTFNEDVTVTSGKVTAELPPKR